MKALLLILLKGYKFAISPMLGQNCRFYPSCSEYAAQAIHEYGACKGSFMTGKRLCKCHPWHPGGVDLVPPKVAPASDKVFKAASETVSENSASAPTSVAGHSSTLS